MRARDNLNNKYPRYHFNKLGKTKLTFDTIDEASGYLMLKHLNNYTIYQFKYCNKYYISHIN